MTAYFAYIQQSGSHPIAGVTPALLCEIQAPATARTYLRRVDVRIPGTGDIILDVRRTTTIGVAGRTGYLFANGENIDYPLSSRTKIITDWKSPPVVSSATETRFATTGSAAAGPVVDAFWSRGMGIAAGGSLVLMLSSNTTVSFPPSVFINLEIEE